MSRWFMLGITLALLYHLAQGDGFSTVPEVVETSLVLSRYTNHSSTIGHWLLFHQLSFPCNCSLASWTFIVSHTPVNTETTEDLEQQLQFQVWRKISNMMYTQVSSVAISRPNISRVLQTNEMGMSLVKFNLNEPVEVKQGDMFGVFQPGSSRSELVLQFQSGLAPAHYVRLTNSPSNKYSLRGAVINYDYPLVAADYGCKEECKSGFASIESLEQFLRSNTNTHLVEHSGISRIFPALNFTCDTAITGIKLGAKPVFGTSWPLVEIWRHSNRVFSRTETINISSPIATASPGVYEYSLSSPLPINTNNVISLYEPTDSRLEVYSETDSGMLPHSVYVLGEGGGDEVFSDDHRPLLTIDTADAGCSNGFISLRNLKRKSLPLALITDFNRLNIVPTLQFPKSGKIVKFTFSGQFLPLTGSNSRELYPEIQVWRLSQNKSDPQSSGYNYIKLASIGNQTAPRFSGYINVYEFVLETPLPVEEGDVLGYYQPPSSSSLMGLVAVNNERTDNYYLFGQNPDVFTLSSKFVGKSTRAPLISFEYYISEVPTTESSNPPGNGNNPGIIIGAAVGVVVVGLVVGGGLVVVVCLVVRLRRRTGGKITDTSRGNNNIHNPTYTDTERDSTPGPTYAEPSEIRPPPLPSPPSPYSQLFYPSPCRPYEQPTPSRSGTIDSSLGPPSYASLSDSSPHSEFAARLRGVGNPLSDEGLTMRSNRLSSKSGSNGRGNGGIKIYEEGIYHEPTELFEPQKKAHAWGVYVPTEEQRASIYYSCPTPTEDEDLYSELIKQGATSQHVYDDHISTASSTVSSSGSGGPAFFQEEPTYWTPAEDTQGLYKQLSSKKYRELSRKQISLLQHLGSGQFGTVVQGVWSSPRGPVDVAVKTLKPGSTETDKIRFLQEAAINGQFRHPNVVKLIGVVTIDQPVMIVLELMSNGDLRNHLVKLRQKSSSSAQTDLSWRLLKFCQDVASGMAYLAAKSFVHRDLAARNILMSHDLTCKISDFGMSRGLEEETYYMSKGGKIPIKWTAPEAIHYKKYSTASDVWSYGMVMYEIWSLGQKPFSNFTNAQTVSLLERSFCLPPPPGTPHEIYSLMVQCWHPDKSCRPSFPSLSSHLSLPVSQLLHWSTEEAAGVGPQAIMLGAPLKTAHKLHMTLQNTYHTQS